MAKKKARINPEASTSTAVDPTVAIGRHEFERQKREQRARAFVFDEERLRQLGELMRLNPTLDDTAAFFECGTTTVESVIREYYGLTFREFREQRMVHTRLALVRKLVQEGQAGNITALIFALKNLNGWSDKVKNEHSGPDGAPIPLKAVSEMTDEELQQRLADYRAKGII